MIATSGNGKTNISVSLLTNPKLFGANVLDAGWAISPSVKVDSTWDDLRAYRAKRGQCGDEVHMVTRGEKKVKQVSDG
ncbi:hypothetical protein N9L68_02950 [bacterium]|nr:hypothetical protein [bacterium]